MCIRDRDFPQFQRSLENTPQEDLTNADAPGKIVSLPLPDGEIGRFKIWETSIFHPNTAANYPQLQSYRGIGLDDKAAAVRIAVSPKGVHLALHTLEGDIYVDPYTAGNTGLYISYYIGQSLKESHPGSCGFSSFENELTPENLEIGNGQPQANTYSAGGPVEMREFVVALSCSGEFAQGHGGTVESVLSLIHI